MAQVWDENWFGSTKTLDMHIVLAAAQDRRRRRRPAADRHDPRRRLPLRALRRVRRRLILSTGAIALAAVLDPRRPARASWRPRRARSDAAARLEREADAVAAAVDDRVERGAAHRPRPTSRTSCGPVTPSWS